ncbi:MAG: hypothetical protein ABSF24_02435 [Candidatus Bathyarchaeia archaeon]|jgi:hypothetical protein
MSQISLDQAAVYTKLCELDALKKLVEEQRATIEALKERIIKLEADAGVTETGLSAIAGALELRGILKNGEAVEASEKEPMVAVKEETFTCLTFEDQRGSKLGEFSVAYRENNVIDKWTSAYNVLQQSNATIKSRYHGPGYVHSYWLYAENRIYRQRLKGS